MTPSELNHLRRLLGWVRCSPGVFQSPEELHATISDLHERGLEAPDEAAQRRLVESYDEARAIPKYVRAALKALQKMVADHDRGEVILTPATDDNIVREIKQIEQSTKGNTE